MRRCHLAVLAVSLALASSTAFAATFAREEAPPPPGNWSVYSGRLVGTGNNVIAPEVGWPGFGVAYLHGMSRAFDLGGKFTFNYGTETTFSTLVGVNLQGLLRIGLLNSGIFSLALEAEPGLGFFFAGGGGLIIFLPFALEAGVHPVPGLAVLLGLELRPQIGIGFSGGSLFSMPILLVNPGVEYAVTPDVLLTVRTGFGPGVLALSGGGSGVGFSFRALVGAAIKL